jgi:hypothetical protein
MGDDGTRESDEARDHGVEDTHPEGDVDGAAENGTTPASGSDTSASAGSAAPGTGDADHAMMQRARARHGVAGAIVAGGMLGLDKVLGRPAKEEVPVVWEAAGEPLDIDNTGITLPVDGDREVHSNPGAADRSDRRVVKRRR